MTVAELIEKLKEVPQDYKIWADGCDCSNPVSGTLLVYENSKTVYIEVDTHA